MDNQKGQIKMISFNSSKIKECKRSKLFKKILRERIKDKMKNMGLENINVEINILHNTPIVGKGIYGESFPLQKPPKIKLEICPSVVNDKQINSVITDELLHVKHPEIEQYQKNDPLKESNEWKRLIDKYKKN